MAGPQDIQRYPRGLIDLLGMRATGDTPHQLSQQTTGILELTDYYLNDRLEAVTSSPSAVIAGTGITNFQLVVPAREMWAVYEYSVTLTPIAAASTLRFAPGYFRSPEAASRFVTVTPSVTCLASEGNSAGIHFERPLLLLPGTIFGVYVSLFTGAPAALPLACVAFSRIGV